VTRKIAKYINVLVLIRDMTHKYLFAYNNGIYNDSEAYREIESIKDSDITRAVVFGGSSENFIGSIFAIPHLYLESKNEIKEDRIYRNLRIYENLINLCTGKLLVVGNSVEISSKDSFEDIMQRLGAPIEIYNQPGIQTAGLVRDYEAFHLLQASVHWFNRMDDKDMKRAEQALQTFVVAEEMGTLVNPHTKDTVRASLYLSAINQLADDPIECTEYHVDHCEVCGKDNISHQSVGHVGQIEKLLRDNFTGDNVEFGVKFIKKSYHRVRSPFLHDGKLSGNEKDGQWSSPTALQFEEDLANYISTSRRLIQLFMQNSALGGRLIG
jgi:hypothetical protein